MHVHVGIDDDNQRIDLMSQASYILPHLLALSTSSPFWEGHRTGLMSYADLGPAEVRDHGPLDDAGKSLLRAAMQQLHMSARAYHRILKLARTSADLAGSETIETAHLAEAIQYRPRRQA